MMSISHAPSLNSFWQFGLIVLSFSSISFSFPPASASTTTLQNHTDRQTLLSFKSLLSDPLGSLASWNNKSLHFCNWWGITCGSRRHPLRVTALNLDSLGLVGPISPSITNLTFLRRIDLSNNQLHGRIPQVLSLLPRLQYLNLSINSLEGEIPSNLSHCPNLKSLSLRNNMLQGEIPSEFGSHRKLQILSASGNNLTGNIPPLLGSSPSLTIVNLQNNGITGGIPSFLANSSFLSVVNLSYNSLTGEIPHSLFNSSSLIAIDLFKNRLTGGIPSLPMIRPSPLLLLGLSMNSLSGSIPPSLGNLSSLLYLYLAENNLEGSIPESLGKIPGLEEIDLSINNLSGRMPPPLYNLSSLACLGVGENRLFGTLPPDLGVTLPNLQSLIMQSNLFHGPIPASLYNASNIQMLDLAMNSFKGSLSSSVGSLKNLVELNLWKNQLQGNVSSVLSSLTNCRLLARLNLQDNKLEGTLPASVGNLSTRLEKLVIGGNQISGTIPVEIGNLVNLTVLFTEKNLFTGSIPPTIGRLRNLNLLDMSGNKFSGPIPSSIGNLTQLSELYMEENELSSNIPASFRDCRNLNILNLSYNALAGSIPKEFVSLPSLTRALDLSHNNLTGSIPMEVGSLINLDCLNISNNRLSGAIPTALGACQHLEYLHLEGNFFQGNIPQSFISLRGLVELDLSRNNLSGGIPEFFGSFSSLQYLNLSVNDLEGEVPKDGVFGNSSETFVFGNKRLCGGDPTLQLPPCSVQASKRNPCKIIIIIIASVVAILFLCFLLISLQLRKRREKSPTVPPMQNRYITISYNDILIATDGFSSANLVGTGSAGSVYKGKLDCEEKFVAVKVFNIQQVGALKSFKTECEIIRNVRHNNLVKIITSCSSMDFAGNDFKALIFEYMPNGSLEEWLHPRAQERHQTRKLNLTQRLNIALDVASALCYLHHNIEVPAIHCDLKPSNVLLDHDMTAHVGDFGLASFLPTSGSTISKNSTGLMGIKGTIGYVAPEYAMGSQISTQGDVYGYGILLLEMLTGRKPTNNMFKDGLNLHKFVDMAFPERVMEILDPQILPDESEEADGNIRNDDFSRMQLRRCIISLIRIGLLCSKESPNERPRMQDVTTKVHAIKEMLSVVEVNEEGANSPE
ncbi:uncharacterized protein [Elaeis guineensis]|uniref:Receptor kinase-like protein Xa21 n=1 Tax=Elaeis guineensis var. tenera TaxID=51953 RepID=A0A6I9RYL1_ELAGV|nr:probable LRR receptor-like serine/threonine-protein kinase At3g47570 [Elaeis guineensis]